MIDITVDENVPAGQVFIFCRPPADVRIESMEDLMRWYEQNPGKVGVITNVGKP